MITRGFIPSLRRLWMVVPFAPTLAVVAQIGSVDPGFAPQLSPLPGYVFSAAVLPDGSVVAQGHFDLVNGQPSRGVTRLRPDGSVDTEFFKALGTNQPWVMSLVVDHEGSILVAGGNFTDTQGHPLPKLIRLHLDGSRDMGFHAESVTNEWYYGVQVAPLLNGKVLVNGVGDYGETLTRLNADGTGDRQIAVPPTFNGLVLFGSVAEHLGGTIIVTSDNPGLGFDIDPPTSFLRLLPDGGVDTSFQFGLTSIPFLKHAAPLPTGGYLVSSIEYDTNSTERLYRLLHNGSPYPGFESPFGPNSVFTALVGHADGRLTVSGSLFDKDGNQLPSMLRLQFNGAIDPGFTPWFGTNGIVTHVRLKDDGRLLVVTNGNSTGVAWLDSSGAPAEGPNGLFERYASVNSVAVQPDGKLLVGGTFTVINGVRRTTLARLHADGSVDADFDAQLDAPSFVQAITQLPAGEFLIQGYLTRSNQPLSGSMHRFATDGTLMEGDAFHHSYMHFDAWVHDIDHQGRLIAGGFFTPTNGGRLGLVSRFTITGGRDPSFDTRQAWSFGGVDFLRVEAQGSVLVGGFFPGPPGIAVPGIVRLHPDGSKDTNYSVTFGLAEGLRPVALQGGGRILMGARSGAQRATGAAAGRPPVDGPGSIIFIEIQRQPLPTHSFPPSPPLPFEPQSGAVRQSLPSDAARLAASVAATPTRGLHRLHTNGSLDAAFLPPLGTNSFISTTIVQADDRILVAGILFDLEGRRLPSLLRLLPDGALDASFSVDTGDVLPSAVVIEPDGNILVGGSFGEFGGMPRTGLVRLRSVEQPRVQSSVPEPGTVRLSIQGNRGRHYTIQTSADLVNWITIQNVFSADGSLEFSEAIPPNSPGRFYRALIEAP
jgi:uncharacterized delta-60 repeat protein